MACSYDGIAELASRLDGGWLEFRLWCASGAGDCGRAAASLVGGTWRGDEIWLDRMHVGLKEDVKRRCSLERSRSKSCRRVGA
jgi:hypothetical protein